MEKCTFCVQRIESAEESRAQKQRKREMKGGDFTTACALSCHPRPESLAI